MNDIRVTAQQFEHICSTYCVRERARMIYDKALSGGTHFKVNQEAIASCALFVQELILENYPDLQVPFHSRWEHFNVGGVDRIAPLLEKMKSQYLLNAQQRAQALADLAIVSVYVDAGAGAQWQYKAKDGQFYNRSEGLAVASLEMFENGLFSSDKKFPLRVDSLALKSLDLSALEKAFQVNEQNLMTGVEGRSQMLKRLGSVMESKPEFFEHESLSRPGNVLLWFARQPKQDAQILLRALLWGFAKMWPPRISVNGESFGDLWLYPQKAEAKFENLVPFHKLSQWLAYSLIAPLSEMGLQVEGVAEFTGLPEYRNGGLLLDMNVLELRDPKMLEQTHLVDSDFMVEWRALTVHLLDEIASVIRANLNKNETDLPLGKILQGGTWLAGRKTAQKLRAGLPPLKIHSDGTVF